MNCKKNRSLPREHEVCGAAFFFLAEIFYVVEEMAAAREMWRDFGGGIKSNQSGETVSSARGGFTLMNADGIPQQSPGLIETIYSG